MPDKTETLNRLTRDFLHDLYGADSEELIVGRPNRPEPEASGAQLGERAAVASI